MNDFSSNLLLVSILKSIPYVLGCILFWLSYKLFKLSLSNSSGEINLSFGDLKIFIKKAAPGTLFLIGGIIIIALSINHRMDISSNKKMNANSNTESQINSDSIFSQSNIKEINLDSLYNTTQLAIKKGDYLVGIKNLSMIKGIMIYNDTNYIVSSIDSQILECEKKIKLLYQNNTTPITYEETRSASINDKGDSIR